MAPSEFENAREAAVARHDAALRRWWPKKGVPAFRSEVAAAAEQLERVFDASAEAGWPPVERSRTARWLADAYSDLAREQRVADGEDFAFLSKAVATYQMAEALLPPDAVRERAVLNFNCANALRRFDIDDVALLESAKARYEVALAWFTPNEPGRVPQIRQALESLLLLLRVAPLAKAVASAQRDIERLGVLVSDKASAAQIQTQLRRVLEAGGPAELARRVVGFLEDLPDSVRARDADGKLRAMLSNLLALSARSPAAGEVGRNAEILGALEARLQRELDEGKLDGVRAATVRAALERLAVALTTVNDDVTTLRGAIRDLRQGAAAFLPALRDASYGLPLPPEGSRAARARALFWNVRRATFVELLTGGGGPRERETLFRLAVRQNESDRELVAAGADDARARRVEEELIRPQVIETRRYSSRMRPCLASPLWPSEPGRVEADAVLYSGGTSLRRAVEAWCRSRGLKLLADVDADDRADTRWRQLATAHVAVFDLAVDPGAALAGVTYELGIAQALGKPVVVAAREATNLPFDLDVMTVRMRSSEDDERLTAAIDAAMYAMPAASTESSRVETALEVARRYAAVPDAAVRQAAKELGAATADTDPLELEAAVEGLLALAPRPRPALIRPPWASAYPAPGERRMFHVMPFRPTWAGEAARRVARACERAGVIYARGDRALVPRVIPSIWREIGRATHVLVDLTDLNPNVALELGWVHLLGKDALLIGFGTAERLVFPSIAKLRVAPLGDAARMDELEAVVTRWLSASASDRQDTPRREERR